MDYKILKSEKIIIENFVIKKKISVGNNTFNFPIKYLSDNLIIQTPILYLPFGMYKYGSNCFLDTSFLNVDVDKEMASFKNLIENINNMVIKFMNKKQLGNKIYVDSIKKSSDLFPDRMKFHLQEDIHIFNEKKNLIDFGYLKSKSYIKLLITPVNIWYNKEKYGITWEILQIKIYPNTVLNTYSFIDDNETDKVCYNSHPKYQKYFKMLNCGVPKEAVKHKMILDNLDPNVLDKGNDKCDDKMDDKSVKDEKKSDNKSIIKSENNISSKLNNLFSGKETSGKKLNILEEIKKNKEKKVNKIIKNSKVDLSINYKPPSVKDILDIKSKLNSVKQ